TKMRQRNQRGVEIEGRQPFAFGHDTIDVLGGVQQILERRLAKQQHRRAATLELAREADEQQYIAQSLLGVEQDSFALYGAAIPRRLCKVGYRCLGQALARLVGGKALAQLATHQQGDGKFCTRPLVVRLEGQRAREAADGLVDTTEVA